MSALPVDLLAAHLAANRFMPVPPEELILCGDGDYRAIGAEFLGHFVRLGGLEPGHRMLDLGSGVGRMAVPLTQYLSESGRYDGVDVAAPGIAWCAATITPAYPNFRFTQVDVVHPLYNPQGALAAETVRLPFDDAAFDFIAMVSVLTHLDPPAVAQYAREVSRLLAPGGKCFATAFLLNAPSRAGIAAGTARPAFPSVPGSVLHADPDAPLAAVAYDEDALLAAFLEAGQRRRPGAAYGHWSGAQRPLLPGHFRVSSGADTPCASCSCATATRNSRPAAPRSPRATCSARCARGPASRAPSSPAPPRCTARKAPAPRSRRSCGERRDAAVDRGLRPLPFVADRPARHRPRASGAAGNPGTRRGAPAPPAAAGRRDAAADPPPAPGREDRADAARLLRDLRA